MLRFVGIDVARRTHLVAIVGETMAVLVKPTPVTEDAAGYEKLLALIGSPADTLIVMEATGRGAREVDDLLLCMGLVGPTAPTIIAAWSEPEPWIPLFGGGGVSMHYSRG